MDRTILVSLDRIAGALYPKKSRLFVLEIILFVCFIPVIVGSMLVLGALGVYDPEGISSDMFFAFILTYVSLLIWIWGLYLVALWFDPTNGLLSRRVIEQNTSVLSDFRAILRPAAFLMLFVYMLSPFFIAVLWLAS